MKNLELQDKECMYPSPSWKAVDGFSVMVEMVVEGYFVQGDYKKNFSSFGIEASFQRIHM